MKTLLSDLQHPVTQYITQFVRPVAIVLDKQFLIKTWAGDPAYFGFDELAVGQDGRDTFLFLVGMDLSEPEDLKFIETPNYCSVHVHFIVEAVEVIFILLDASVQRQQYALLQQKSNELSLLQTRQSRLISHLQQLEKELDLKRQQAVQENEMKGRFIATMSHEFRSPLTSILGYTDRLQGVESFDHPIQKYLCGISRSAEHLLNLVENLLDHAQIESGHLTLNPTTTPIRQVVQKISSLFETLAEDKALHFNVHIESEVPAYLLLDELRFRQILVNLIANAIKFTEQGDVSLSLSWANDELMVRIVDSGKGIAEADQERIFTAFEKLDQHPGTGLGLTIVKHLLSLMNGKLHLSSTKGLGTCFEISLPAKAIHLQTKPAQKKISNTLDLAKTRLKKVLLVEDDPDIMMLLQDIFEEAHINTLQANNGQQAVKIALADAPELVLLDVNLPDMMGFEVSKTLREHHFYQPIFAQSAWPMPNFQTNAIMAGCNECLEKPLDLFKFKRLIADYFPEIEPSSIPLARQQELQQAFQNTLSDKFSRLEILVQQLKQSDWDDKPLRELCDFVHRLAGSSGLYGMHDVCQASKQLNRLLNEYATLKNQNNDELKTQITCVISLLTQQLRFLI